MKKLIFLFLLIFPLALSAQQLEQVKSILDGGEDANVVYRNEATWSIYAHSAAGMGLNFSRGWQVNVDRKRMFEIEASNFKHIKETKSLNGYASSFQGYFYGKLNSILLFRSGVGFQNVIYQKTNKKNVQIRYSTMLGGILAFAKPIYLEVQYRKGDVHNNDTVQNDVVLTERYNSAIHSSANILGKAPFFEGIGKTKIVPGAYAKVSLSFEYADSYIFIKAIETGFIADVYPASIEIMANDKQYLLLSLYVKMVWGRKWY